MPAVSPGNLEVSIPFGDEANVITAGFKNYNYIRYANYN
jgi:hypothetical protein